MLYFVFVGSDLEKLQNSIITLTAMLDQTIGTLFTCFAGTGY
jgi:hypothetical protein